MLRELSSGIIKNVQTLSVALHEKLGLIPPVAALLAALPDGVLMHVHYGVRHPLGTFNMKFGRIVSDLSNCVANVNSFSATDDYPRVLAAFEQAISSFSGFIEASNEIFLAICPKHRRPGDKEFIHNWLKDRRYSLGKSFYQRIRNETTYFREIFNRLKHSGNRLRGLAITNGSTRSVGYCLEHTDAAGANAPIDSCII
jgi:hypothetical protein